MMSQCADVSRMQQVYVFRLLLEWARLTSDDAYNKNAAAVAAQAGRKAAVKQ